MTVIAAGIEPAASAMDIAILGVRADPHVSAVEERLKAAGAQVFVVDDTQAVDWSLQIDGPSWCLKEASGAEWTRFDIVWDHAKLSLPTGGDEYRRRYIQSGQWISFFNAVYDLAEGRVVNARGSNRELRTKVGEMRLAALCGFNTPSSFIPGSAAELKSWRPPDELILKPLGFANAPSEDDPEFAEAVLTLPVNRGGISSRDDAGLKSAPHFFQLKIQKAYELRVQATRRCVHAFAIDSQTETAALTDWRAAAAVLPIEPISLPESITEALQLYLRRAGLYFGAFDLIVDPEGGYTFLECNANGQWWWLQTRCEVDIASSIAEAIRHAAFDYQNDEEFRP